MNGGTHVPQLKGEVKFQDKLYAEKQPPREY